jgi:hypothetical protein
VIDAPVIPILPIELFCNPLNTLGSGVAIVFPNLMLFKLKLKSSVLFGLPKTIPPTSVLVGPSIPA